MKCFSPICNISIESFSFQPIDSRMYILYGSAFDKFSYNAIVIDPFVCNEALSFIENNCLKKILVILTHEHYDHISGVNWLKSNVDCKVMAQEECSVAIMNTRKNSARYFEALFCLYNKEKQVSASRVSDINYTCCADLVFQDIIKIKVESCEFKLIHTPGHSKGSICIILNDSCVFTGDSLLRVPVVLRLPGSSKHDYENITKPFINNLGTDIMVYPGHGDYGMLNEMCLE